MAEKSTSERIRFGSPIEMIEARLEELREARTHHLADRDEALARAAEITAWLPQLDAKIGELESALYALNRARAEGRMEQVA